MLITTAAEESMSRFTMTIDGEEVTTEAVSPVVNPATGQEFAAAPLATMSQLDAAMTAAQRAYEAWRYDEPARRDALHHAAEALVAAADDIGPVLTAEQGKPLAEAKFEVRAAGEWFRYYADLAIPRETLKDDEQAFVEVLRRPLGVVAAITPWNVPLAIAARKIAPALLAGNAVVLKPSPFTPLSTLELGSVLRGALPAGVLNVVSGDDALGKAMTDHPVPRKISFTGSVATGKQVAVTAARDLKRVTLELGGNDPAIVLDDADPAAIADGLFWGAFANNGQVCAAVKRIYVPEKLYGDMVEALAERAAATKIGDGMDEGSELGPINNRPQFERVQSLVLDALEHGGHAATGGRPIEGPGYFFEPTIIEGVVDGHRIVDEEQFGPALPVVAYRDLDDALARANATHFGLSGSVWTRDPERGATVAEHLECGTAWVNTHMAFSRDQPFSGVKWSGIGVENGPWGLLDFTQIQVVHRARS
jgi:acyl-CoA reductase-like NAD-dependent aldehyde dehydrogenase